MMRATVRFLLCTATSVAAGLGGLPPAAAATKINPVTNATYVFRDYRTLSTAYSCWWIETTPVSGDTVLHALRWNGTAYVETAHNDDYPGRGTGSSICVPSGTYVFVVRAYSDSTGGTFNYHVGGTLTLSNQPFGGKSVLVQPYDEPVLYETALRPSTTTSAASTDTYLYGLDSSGAIISYDDDSGVGTASRLPANANMWRVIVASYTPSTAGNTILYLNDTQNDYSQDGDGLGWHLEQALGTCDYGGDPGCSQTTGNKVHNFKDSDRDGLADNVELFGVDLASDTQNGYTTPAESLLLPKWGADPRHKDIFIEADYTDAFAAPGPVTQQWALNARTLFGPAPAADIGNLDGIDGVNVHVDNGVAAPVGYSTLYGNWGRGGNRGAQATLGSWWTLYPTWDNRRQGYFRHIVEASGTGSTGFAQTHVQGNGNDFYNGTMHEFSHALGFNHEGYEGGLNCSPLTPVIYSYNQWASGRYLTGRTFLAAGINPSSLCEADGVGSQASDSTYRDFLRNGYGFNTVYNPTTGVWGVDWNRDGVVSPCTTRVRASVNWGPHGGDAHAQGELEVSRQDGAASDTGVGAGDTAGTIVGAPSLIRYGNFLYLFYVKEAGGVRNLYYRAGGINTNRQNAGCTGSIQLLGNDRGPAIATPCTTWSSPTLVFGLLAMKRFAVVALSDRIEIAQSNTTDTYLDVWHLSGQHPLSGIMSTTAYLGGFANSSSPRSDLQYETVRAQVTDPSSERLALFWIDTNTREIRWASKPAGSTAMVVSHGAIRNNAVPSAAIVAHDSTSVSLASWGSGMTGSLARQTFMVFHDASGSFRIYYLDSVNEQWIDRTALVWPTGLRNGVDLNQKVGFKFQHNLDSLGNVMAQGQGIFYLALRNNGGANGILHTLNGGSVSGVPQALGSSRPPSTHLKLELTNKYGHDYHQFGTGAGYTYFSDSTIPALKAAFVDVGGSLQYAPFADGIFNMVFKPINDWQVMEATICRSLRAPVEGDNGDDYCGHNGVHLQHPVDLIRSTETKWGY